LLSHGSSTLVRMDDWTYNQKVFQRVSANSNRNPNPKPYLTLPKL